MALPVAVVGAEAVFGFGSFVGSGSVAVTVAVLVNKPRVVPFTLTTTVTVSDAPGFIVPSTTPLVNVAAVTEAELTLLEPLTKVTPLGRISVNRTLVA